MISSTIPSSSGQYYFSFLPQGEASRTNRLFIELKYIFFSLSLCFEDINLQDNEELKFILKIVNMVFAVLFTIEMFLKWIAFGLYKYFSSVWTCLDFIIVIVSDIISISTKQQSFVKLVSLVLSMKFSN